MTEHYADRPVVVTGGLGFIGSTLVLRLIELGARVTIIDGSIPGCGANEFNLAPVKGRYELIRADLSQSELYEPALAEARTVFNLAGEISHIQSMRDPERDLRLNTFSQLRLLATLARVNPGARVVYAGTRQVCGRPRYLPVDEDHPIEPVDFNGIHKRAAEHYHLLMSRDGLIDAVVLRLTNVYGPRLAIGVPGQGFLSAFLARVIAGQPLEVFGDGQQLRDPVYVDDAVDAFMRIAVAPRPQSRLYHLGGPAALSLLEIARIVSRAAGLPQEVTLRPFPPEHLRFDIGSYTTDSKRLQAALDWTPLMSFPEGIRRTLAYFRKHRDHYLLNAAPHPVATA
jgi:UDP-glucose 4-epimerase